MFQWVIVFAPMGAFFVTEVGEPSPNVHFCVVGCELDWVQMSTFTLHQRDRWAGCPVEGWTTGTLARYVFGWPCRSFPYCGYCFHLWRKVRASRTPYDWYLMAYKVRHTGFDSILSAFPSQKNGARSLTFQSTHHAHKNVNLWWGNTIFLWTNFFWVLVE